MGTAALGGPAGARGWRLEDEEVEEGAVVMDDSENKEGRKERVAEMVTSLLLQQWGFLEIVRAAARN